MKPDFFGELPDIKSLGEISWFQKNSYSPERSMGPSLSKSQLERSKTPLTAFGEVFASSWVAQENRKNKTITLQYFRIFKFILKDLFIGRTGLIGKMDFKIQYFKTFIQLSMQVADLRDIIDDRHFCQKLE
jgi:hypothetical protein